MQVSVTGLSTILPFVFLSKLKRLLHSINAYRRFLPYTILSAILIIITQSKKAQIISYDMIYAWLHTDFRYIVLN